jgi:hypothetical protein
MRWALVLAFALSLPAVTTRFYASDEVEFYAWLRSTTFDRDVDFGNEYQYFYDSGVVRSSGFRDTFVTGLNEAGRRPNFTPIGTALLWAPFFAGGHLTALAIGAPANGFSQPYIAAVTYGSAFYGFAALLLTAAVVRRVIGPHPIATVAIWLGSPLLFYMYVAPGFAHAPSAFTVSLFLWIWLSVRDQWSPSGVAVLAAAGAVMAMVREQDAFFVLGPLVDFVQWSVQARTLWSTRARLGRSLGTAFAGIATFALVYAPQLGAYAALNGHPGPTRLVARKMTWTAPHFFDVLFSPQHGLFFWTPLALLGLSGLVWMTVRRAGRLPDSRWVGGLLLMMFGLQIYVSGSVESWTVAGSFGQRRFVATTPLLAVGLAVLIEQASGLAARRWILALALGLGVWWNLGLIAQFGLHTMDRQRLALARNARATFIELPLEGPALAWRYLTDRSSFFGRTQSPGTRRID